MIELNTHLEKSSPFYLVYNENNKFCETLSKYSFDKIFFITEKNIFELYKHGLYQTVNKNFDCDLEIIPAGELSKSFESINSLGDSLMNKGVSKNSILIAFGGGVVGNLVGMIAGLLFRGIRFIEVPTNMTSQTDSTLSNKQAVNSKQCKNLFGFYYAPIFIWADTFFLKTEPMVSRKSGIIEAIKNGFISDEKFLNYLEDVIDPKMKFSDSDLHQLVYSIIKSKLNILKKDPTEKGYGIILEYGHTFGHAIEWLLKGRLSHGEAVSYGMKLAAHLSKQLGLISREIVDYHYYMIEDRLGFNAPFPDNLSSNELVNLIKIDNKKTNTKLRFVLLDKTGSCLNKEGDYLVTVDEPMVMRILNKFFKS